MSDERDDAAIYMAVVNQEGQYSIWPCYRELPLGWTEAGKHGTRAEVLAWIKEVWTDMQPPSPRNKMQQAGLGPDEADSD